MPPPYTSIPTTFSRKVVSDRATICILASLLLRTAHPSGFSFAVTVHPRWTLWLSEEGFEALKFTGELDLLTPGSVSLT